MNATPSFAAAALFYWDFVQSNALDGGPDDRQAPHLSGEHIILVAALPHVAKQTRDGVGRAEVAMHRLRKVVKGEGLVLFLA
jgi:hypothetical protein